MIHVLVRFKKNKPYYFRYNKSTLTSIERRYGLDSSMIGLMQSSFHIGNLTFILYVSYFGSKWHRYEIVTVSFFFVQCKVDKLITFEGVNLKLTITDK